MTWPILSNLEATCIFSSLSFINHAQILLLKKYFSTFLFILYFSIRGPKSKRDFSWNSQKVALLFANSKQDHNTNVELTITVMLKSSGSLALFDLAIFRMTLVASCRRSFAASQRGDSSASLSGKEAFHKGWKEGVLCHFQQLGHIATR